jgi:phage recombination protein Bet
MLEIGPAGGRRNLVAQSPGALLGTRVARLRPHQLDLIRRTVAAECTNEEFDLFIEAAERYGLDPFRRQIMPLVFSKEKPEKRRMVIVVGIDGQRMIAQRAGNYRPASEPTHFVENRRKKGPTNPLGLVLARVTLFQQDNRGDWFPVMGEAYWDEFAPIRDEWEEDLALGWRKTGRQVLDSSGSWPKMPRLMLGKCATMQALRAGWPDQFGNLYAEEELDRARALDLSASQAAERARAEQRLAAIAGKDAILASFEDWTLQNVPLGQFADRVLAFTEGKSPEAVKAWAEANREALRHFWASHPGEALELKKIVEAKSKAPSEAPGPARNVDEPPSEGPPAEDLTDSAGTDDGLRTAFARWPEPVSPFSPREP